MPQFFRRKLIFLVTVLLLLSGVFLFSKTADSAWDANAYNKPYNGTLTATEWNNLFLDFANTWLPVTLKGPVTIGGATSSSLSVNGSVSATTFSGAYTGTLGAQNISSGQFGSNTGGGNYSFPGNLGIGTTTPTASLHVNGSVKLNGLASNTAVKAITAENDGTIGTRELSQMAFKDEADYTLNSTNYMTFMSSPGYVDTYYARFKVTITRPGDNVSGQVMFVEIYGSKNYVPSIIVKSSQNSTSSTDSGLRYLRVSYPTARNNGAPVHIDMAAYSADARDVKVEMVEAKNLELRQTIVSSLYNSSNQTITTPSVYYNGNVFNKTIYGSVSGSAGSASYSNYGVYGGYSLSNTASKTGQWEYIGNVYLGYNSTYSFGQSWNLELKLREVISNNTDRTYDQMEEAQITLKGFMAAAANGTAFRDNVPSFSVYLNGNDLGLTPSDIAMLVYSADTSSKYLRLYVKLKNPNTHYQILPQNRYGASYSAANGVSPDYCYFNTVTSQAVIAALPLPYQGSVVYATQGSGTGVWRLNGINIYNSNAGNVGVGTSTPSSKLTLSGGDFAIDHNKSFIVNSATQSTTLLLGNYADGGGFNYGTSTSPLRYSASLAVEGDVKADRLCIEEDCKAAWSEIVFAGGGGQWITSGNNIYNANSANVGIGLTNPTSKLGVAESEGTESIRALLTGSPDVGVSLSSNSLSMRRNTSSTLGLNISTVLNSGSWGTNGGYIALSPNNTEIMRMTASGNVGIGTTAPSSKLDIEQTSAGSLLNNLELRNADITNAASGVGISLHPTTANWGAKIFTDRGSKTGYVGSLAFGVTSSGNPEDNVRMVINANTGNVGIGTTNPTVKLYVNGGTGNVLNIGGGQIAGLNSTPVNTDQAVPLGYLQSNYVPIGSGSGGLGSGTSGQTLRHNGTSWVGNSVLYNNGTNVGVGTTNPTKKFAVSGEAYISSKLAIGASDRTDIGDLHITSASTTAATIPLIRLETTTNSDTPFIRFQAKNSSGSVQYADFIFNPDSGNLGFKNPYSSSERLVINSSGNIGIGITNPSALLQLSNTTNPNLSIIGGSGTTVQLSAYDGTNYSRVGTVSGHQFNLMVGGTNVVRLDETSPVANTLAIRSGNVGVGTTSPTVKLHVSGGTGNVLNVGGGQIAGLNSTPVNTDQAVPLGYLQSNYVPIGSGSGGIGSGTSGQTLRHNGTSWVANSILYNNGTNVGIGTSTPAYKLDVVGGGIRNYHATDPYLLLSQGVNNAYLENYSGKLHIQARSLPIYFETDSSYTVPKMMIGIDGNVGIGTTAPNSKLDVFGSAVSSGNSDILTINTNSVSTGYYGSLVFRQSSSNIGSRITSGNAGSYKGFLAFETSRQTSAGLITSEAMRIDGAGNVGVGITNPTVRFHVSGGTGNVLDVSGGQISGLNSTPVNTDQAVPLGYLQSNYVPIGSGSGGIGSGTSGQTLRHNGTSWVANSTLYNNGTNVGIGTTNPGFPVDINANNYDAQLRIRQTTGTGYAPASVLLSAGESDSRGQGLFHYNEVSDTSWFTGIPYSTQSNKWIVAYKSAASWDGTVAQLSNALFTIQNNGNVGIGTTTPTRKLDVVGSVGFSGVLYGPGSNNYWDSSTFDLAGGTGTIYTRYIKDSSGNNNITVTGGNVGIGITNPSAKLYVSGGTGNVLNVGGGQIAGLNSTPVNTDQAVPLGYLQSNYVPIGSGSGGIGSGTSGQTLRHNGTSWVANSTLFNNGTNVGIGTTNPRSKLQIGEVTTGTGEPTYQGDLILQRSSASSQSAGGLEFKISASGSGYGWKMTALNDANVGLAFAARNNNATWSDRMYITNSGNVGLGTTNPTANLDVSGRTFKFSNFYPTYSWKFGGSSDLNWKTIANVTLGSGTYVGAAFEMTVLNTNNNYGSSVNMIPMRYYVRMTRSGSVQDDTNDAQVSGPIADYVRVVKTATGVYELQVRQLSDWRHMEVTSRAVSINNLGSGGSISYVDNPANGSTSGTNYVATSVHTDYFTNGFFSGNLGIGTTAPGKKLTVSSGITDDGLYVTNTLGSNTGVYTLLSGSTAGTVSGTTYEGKIVSQNNNNFVIGTPTAVPLKLFTNNTVRMTLDGAGNVGIGTTNPTAKLHVSGGTGNVLDVSGGQIAGLNSTPVNTDQAVPLGYLQNNYVPIGSGSGGLGAGTSGQTLRHNGTSWVANSTLYNNGTNVGIGTTNPVARLQVNGGVALKRTTVADANYTAQADDYIIGYTSISANRTVTLPNALCTPGRFFVVVDESGNASASAKILIDPEGTTPIIGLQNLPLQDSFNSVYVFCGNSAWYIL